MPTSYSLERTRVPNPSLLILQRLARTLVRDKPKDASAVVLDTLALLVAVIAEVDEVLAQRFRESNPAILTTAREFDGGVDTGWVWLRRMLIAYSDFFGHPGLDALPAELADKIGLAKLRERAKLAGELHDRLFAAEGTKWVKHNWMAQSETMATLLRVIETDELDAKLDEVGATGEFAGVLKVLQAHYEDIVAERMGQTNQASDDLNALRAKLRWHITHYQGAVETMRNPAKAESFELVDQALRSIDLLAARMAVAGSAEELDDLLDEDAFEPFVLEVDEGEGGADDASE